MNSLIGWIVCLLLTVPALASGAAKEDPPDREMLKMMEFLREMEMIKQMEMLQDMQTLESADGLAKGEAPPRNPPRVKKENIK
jgi:hypothetical protein